MRLVNNRSQIDNVLLEKDLFILGTAGTGKTVYLKNLVSTYLSKKKRVGIICLGTNAIEWTSNDHIHVFKLDNPAIPVAWESLKAFINDLDLVVIDEGGLSLSLGENLHSFLDLCKNKRVIVSLQSLDVISKSPIFIESIVTRFDEIVTFKNRNSFSLEFIVGMDVAKASELLGVGEALHVSLNN